MSKKKKTDENPKKTRRGKNEGGIRWIESKGLYEGRYTIGYDANGKRKTKAVYSKKKSEVVQKVRDALSAMGKGEYVDPSDKSLITWCKEWYEIYKKPKLRINTRGKYEVSAKRIENADIAFMSLKDISQEILQKYYNELIEQYSEETVKATHSLINGALEKAEETNMIYKNPARFVIIPKKLDDEDKDAKALTELEYERFMYEMGKRSHYYAFALFMANTGLRPNETVALNRNDIVFDKNTVKVTKTYVRATKSVQNSPKTSSSKRTVPIPENIIKLLKEYMLKQKNQKDTDPLFQTLKGTRISIRNVLRTFKSIGEDIGCPWINLHSMRHTFASRLFREKIDIKVISQLLGHKEVSTTYDIYVHFIDNIVEDSVQVLNKNVPETLPEKNRKKKNNVVVL